MNSSGDLRLIIRKDIPPKAISQKEKNVIINGIDSQAQRRGIKLTEENLEAACQFPSHRPFFNRMLVDEAGRIYVREAESILDRSGEVHLDVYSREGYYLYRLAIPFNPEFIRKGFMYDVSNSEETGEVRIKRFRIGNWDRMET
jgi:hypothetical protein